MEVGRSGSGDHPYACRALAALAQEAVWVNDFLLSSSAPAPCLCHSETSEDSVPTLLPTLLQASGTSNSSQALAYDAFTFPTFYYGELAAANAMLDLEQLVRSDPNQVLGIPIVESPFLMYVNWPLLTSVYNISRPVLVEYGRLSFYPDTWQELIAVMRQVNATASDPVTGKPRHGLCLQQASDIVYVHQAIMASIMQTGGVTQGWLFDPLTLEPLTNNTASEKVLDIVWELSAFFETFDAAVAIDMSQCVVALGDVSIFKSLSKLSSNPQLMGQLGISPLPASTEVLDRSTMQLVPCNPQLCNSHRASVMSTLVPEQLRSAVFNLISFFSRLAYQVGDPWDQPGITLWSANGYNYTDVKAYDSALSSILALPGTATELRVLGTLFPTYMIESALHPLLGSSLASSGSQVPRSAGSPADFVAAMDAMTVSLKAARDSLGAAAFREQLWGTTGFVPPAQPPPPAPPSPPPAGSPGLTTPVLVTVIAVPVAVCSLLVLLLAVIITHLRRNAKLQRSLMGHVLPPAAGDKATLVITDVQGSSKLWETMPAGVMEVSMKLHDELVRRLALDSSGYEWATEGDSFLLCFHSPQAAVTFVTQLQDALLRCSQWPVELAAEGSPSQPLCLAPVGQGPRITDTPGSCTNASNQTLPRLLLTSAASATQIIGQLPSPPEAHQQLLLVTVLQGLLGLMAHHAAHQMAMTAPWQSERGDRTQASDSQKLESEVCSRRIMSGLALMIDYVTRHALQPSSKEAPAQPLGQVRVGWQRLCELYQEVEAGMPAALTVLAGLRVRVGLHTGLAADEVLVQRRMGASSITYGGAALVLAKAVQLPVEELRAAGISVVHMGQHLVALGEGKGATALELYCACLNTPDHAHRLWALGPLRTLRQVQPGVLHAPYGTAAIAFMSVVGLSHLKAWNADLAKECVALYQAAAQRLLLHVSGPQLPAGYWVSSAEEEGMVLAAFPCSLQCLHWALLTLTTCMDMDWPQALLDSLFGEEVTACLDTSGSKAGVSQAPATGDDEGQQQTAAAQGTVRLLRGLRLKAGVDVGEVACDLTPANGRFNYRGRCLNRAARINGLAVSGQVWCSEIAWANTLAALQPPITTKEARAVASLAADQPAASTASWSAQGSKQAGSSIARSTHSSTAQPKRVVSFQPAAAQGRREVELVTGPAPGPAVLDVSHPPPQEPPSNAAESSVTAQWHAAQQQLHSSTQAGSGAGGEGAERPSASLLSQGQPLCLPGLLPPLVARPLGKRELRGIPGQVALLQVALAPHTSRAQLEAADRLGLSAPGLQLSRPQQPPAIVADSPDTCPANCTALASDQCFSKTAAYVASVVSRQAALPVGSGVDRGLQGFLENKTSDLLSQCFPNAGTTELRVAATGISVVVHTLPTTDLVTTILQQMVANLLPHAFAEEGDSVPLLPTLLQASGTKNSSQAPAYDAYTFQTFYYGDLAAANAMLDLEQLISLDPNQVLSIPIVETPFLMYVNWPLLTSVYNISRPVLVEYGRLSFYPDTWQELIAVMRQVNATASDPVTGKPRHGLCLQRASDIVYVHQAVMASIMQTGGVTQGWLFDPLTLEPLTNNTASEKVLRIVWELTAFLRTFDAAVAIDMSQCVVALGDVSIFKSLSKLSSNPQLMGQLDISPLPASTEVLDRSTMQLVPCTTQLCNNQRASIMSTLVPEQLRSAVFNLISFFSECQAIVPFLEPVPYAFIHKLTAYQLGDPWDQPGLSMWSTYGYNYTDVKAYDSALSSILALPGTSMELRVLGTLFPTSMIESALQPLLGSSPASSGSSPVPRSAGSPADFAAAMTAMTVSLTAARDSVGSPGLTTPVLVTVIAVPVAVCSLLVLLLAVIITHLRRNAKLQRSLMGHVLPPAAGDKATLVITDVQGSSKLWELMPAGVMEVSMKLHDELVRRLALDSSGYEWATEGDSFLLCFHSPQAAVAFATQLQDALLKCSQWPVELAEEGSPGQPLCLAPVWPGSYAGTSGSCTNASNQTLSRLMLTSAASATQSASQLPIPLEAHQQLLMGDGATEVPCLASFSFVATGQLDAQPHQATPASALACPSEALPKQCTNPIFAPGAAERHVSTAIVPTPATSMSNSQPAKMSTYLSEAAVSKPSSKEAPAQPLGQVRVGWQRLCELYQEVEAAMPAALTVLAGLRVRVGLHTGLAADEVLVQRRMGASSITYGGAALVLAKAVQLPVEELRAAGISVVHMGQHLVALGEGKGATALELYCACLNTPDHAHRLWAMGPLRTLRQMQPGVLHAPYGTAAIAFMSVVGQGQLKALNAQLAKECVALYQAAAQRLLLHVSGPQLPAGYWVSSAEEEGMVLAAFPCSLQCLHWALLTLTTCMDMDWPQALLDSLFGEEVTACLDTSGSKAGVSQAPATGDDEGQQQRAAAQGTVRLLRGLRLKVGVDVGEVTSDLTPANGRFNYRGRCLNRAARINGLAVSGQVWCSETAWANTLAALQPIITTKEARALASLAADQPAASTASWSAQGSKQVGSSIARSTHSSTAQPKRVVSFQPAAVQDKKEVELVTGPAPGPAVLDVSHPPPQEPPSNAAVSSVTAQWHAAQQQLHSSTQAGGGAGGEGTERPSASLFSQGQPLCLPGLLPPLVARPLGKRELRGIPGQVALLQVALAPHTSRAQLEAADRLGLSAPGLQLSRPQQQAAG
ncbi:hypothetical protein QJQ45_000070 [Haematococcus lacustris]|nr:hypothetical protein QJQ45_000070 [Haematococcus lacustris]